MPEQFPALNVDASVLFKRRRRSPLRAILTIGGTSAVVIGLLFLLPYSWRVGPLAVVRPAWYGAVVDYLEVQDRSASIKKFYPTEPLDGAMVYSDDLGLWLDARGPKSNWAFGSTGRGEGYCDSTCEFGVRVEYTVDEGFGREGKRDSVFFLTGDNKVTGRIPTEYVRFRSAKK
jgi:hypothetical protein